MVIQGKIARSPHDRVRRTALAAASGGCIERVRVVVYVSAPTPDSCVVTRACRDYAELHDWHVEEVLSETTNEPPPQRHQLNRALSMVADRTIVGIVTANRSMISLVDADVTSLEETLRRAGAFLAVLPQRSVEMANSLIRQGE